MRFRPAKKSDQKNTEKAYRILVKITEEHPEIEESLWAGALMSAFVSMHINSELPYEEFCKSLDDVKKVYKNWYED